MILIYTFKLYDCNARSLPLAPVNRRGKKCPTSSQRTVGPIIFSPEKTAVNFDIILFWGTSYSIPRIVRTAPAVNMFARRGAKALCQSTRCFSSTATQQADFTHAVIGGGAVGLAIARRLQQRDGVSTVLIEKHGMVGSETSSRNSEVIHRIRGMSMLKVY